MNKAHLRACPACARHVRVSEASCPFCGGTLSEAFRASPPPVPPRVRLSRAALFAFGTGTASLAACGGSIASTNARDASAETPDTGPIGEPAYGGSVPVEILDAGYGAAPIDIDSGVPVTESEDSGHSDADGAPVETFFDAYGAPPIED